MPLGTTFESSEEKQQNTSDISKGMALVQSTGPSKPLLEPSFSGIYIEREVLDNFRSRVSKFLAGSVAGHRSPRNRVRILRNVQITPDSLAFCWRVVGKLA